LASLFYLCLAPTRLRVKSKSLAAAAIDASSTIKWAFAQWIGFIHAPNQRCRFVAFPFLTSPSARARNAPHLDLACRAYNLERPVARSMLASAIAVLGTII
jgi:hypothetical protein